MSGYSPLGRAAVFAIATMLGAVAGGIAVSANDNDQSWQVSGDLLGKPKKHGGAKPAQDLSGIACEPSREFPRRCVVIDDEAQAAQVVILHDGKIVAGDSIRLNNDEFDDKPLEADGEGVAYADGYFYVIGSHGHPRKAGPDTDPAEIAAKITASGRIYRIRLDAAAVSAEGRLGGEPEVARTVRLKEALAAIPEIAPAIDKRLQDGGITIEGVAVRGDRLLAGLRGPLIGGRAAVVSVALDALFGEGRPLDPKLALLDLGRGRGVRDMAADGDGFLILAGPTLTADDGYALYRWDGKGEAKHVADLRDGGGWLSWLGFGEDDETKPEAILPLGDGRVLVLLDGAEGGKPRAVRVGE